MSELRDKVRAIMVKAVARHMDLSDAIDEITELIEPKEKPEIEIHPAFNSVLSDIKNINILHKSIQRALEQNKDIHPKSFKP